MVARRADSRLKTAEYRVHERWNEHGKMDNISLTVKSTPPATEKNDLVFRLTLTIDISVVVVVDSAEGLGRLSYASDFRTHSHAGKGLAASLLGRIGPI